MPSPEHPTRDAVHLEETIDQAQWPAMASGGFTPPSVAPDEQTEEGPLLPEPEPADAPSHERSAPRPPSFLRTAAVVALLLLAGGTSLWWLTAVG